MVCCCLNETHLLDAVPIEQACLDSHKYKLHFGENKTELVQKLWSIFDQRVFDSKLNDDIVSFVWSNWHFVELSAGTCCYRIRFDKLFRLSLTCPYSISFNESLGMVFAPSLFT